MNIVSTCKQWLNLSSFEPMKSLNRRGWDAISIRIMQSSLIYSNDHMIWISRSRWHACRRSIFNAFTDGGRKVRWKVLYMVLCTEHMRKMIKGTSVHREVVFHSNPMVSWTYSYCHRWLVISEPFSYIYMERIIGMFFSTTTSRISITTSRLLKGSCMTTGPIAFLMSAIPAIFRLFLNLIKYRKWNVWQYARWCSTLMTEVQSEQVLIVSTLKRF